MISEQKKHEILTAIELEEKKLGSFNKVAAKLGVSSATLSANVRKPENWYKVSSDLWASLAASLGVSLVSREWNLVKTTNLKLMHQVLTDAQREGMFMAVSEKAGSGKTASIAAFKAADTQHAVYVMQCEEWSKKTFLHRLASELGITTGRYDSTEFLTEGIVRFFKQRAKDATPLLILDEADKLKPSALRFLIVLYNRLEDEVGLVVAGTDNLEKEIKRGVRKAEKGYDEIDSRLGRSFVHLVGATRADVNAICEANGVLDPDAQARVWADSAPIRKSIGKGLLEIVEDLRTVKRRIKRELLKLSNN